ncbi:MAG: SMI1/KNR4 family protein [Archangium sp.]
MSRLLEEVSREHFPHPPVTPEEIEEFERRMGWKLDPDLRAFYLHCNGARLFEPPPSSPFRILPLSEIERGRAAIFGEDDDQWGPPSIYAICDVQDGDYVMVDVSRQVDGRYPLLDGWKEAWRNKEYTWPLASSFSEFLAKALRSNGRQFWLDQHEK